MILPKSRSAVKTSFAICRSIYSRFSRIMIISSLRLWALPSLLESSLFLSYTVLQDRPPRALRLERVSRLSLPGIISFSTERTPLRHVTCMYLRYFQLRVKDLMASQFRFDLYCMYKYNGYFVLYCTVHVQYILLQSSNSEYLSNARQIFLSPGPYKDGRSQG